MNSTFDRISLEPSRVCSKRCSFCYNGSTPAGVTGFSGAEVVELGRDCARHGVAFLSIGGGEPLEWPGLFEALDGLRGVVSRTFTTNGLQFIDRPSLLDDVARAAPDNLRRDGAIDPGPSVSVDELPHRLPLERALRVDRR